MFRKKNKIKKFPITITFKTSLEESDNPSWILMSEPITVDDRWCYSFRNMLRNKVLSVSFLDQDDKITTKTYPCSMQTENKLIFTNTVTDPEQYGKIMFLIPKIDTVGEKKLISIAEVGNFEKTLNGAYKDYSLKGKTVDFIIKYTKIEQEDEQ